MSPKAALLLLALLLLAPGAVAQAPSDTFIAHGYSTTTADTCFATSNDGLTWTASPFAPKQQGGFAIGIGGGMAVLGPRQLPGALYFTFDGDEWASDHATDRTNFAFGEIAWRLVQDPVSTEEKEGGVFIGSNAITGTTGPVNSYSADGLSWRITAPTSSMFESVVGSPNKFVMIKNQTATTTSVVYWSVGGASWTTVSVAAANAWRDITWGITGNASITDTERYVTVSSDGSGNQVMVSPTAETSSWVTKPEATTAEWVAVTTNGTGRFVAVSTVPSIMWSDGAETWQQGSIDTSGGPVPSDAWADVEYGADIWVALNEGGDIFTSTDGDVWFFNSGAQLATATCDKWEELKFGQLGTRATFDAPSTFLGAPTNGGQTAFGTSATFMVAFMGLALAGAVVVFLAAGTNHSKEGLIIAAVFGLGAAIGIGFIGKWVALLVFVVIIALLVKEFNGLWGGTNE